MSREAIAYVKHLKTAPDGSKIKTAEKAVLMLLADWHNEKVGFAWPSMKELAIRCGITARYCRSVIESLERKRVIQRAYTRKPKSGQSSNFFFFSALDKPEKGAKFDENMRKFLRTPRIQMPKSVGRTRPAQAVKCIREGLTHTTGSPGRGRPPIESLGEPLGEPSGESSLKRLSELVPPTPHAAVRGTNSVKTFPASKTTNAFLDLGLAQKAWDAVLQELRKARLTLSPPGLEKRPGISNGTKDSRSFRFNDVTVESVCLDDMGFVVLVMRSPRPKDTARGFELYQSHIALALWKFYGCKAKLVLQGGK